jgi:hypothetical protein
MVKAPKGLEGRRPTDITPAELWRYMAREISTGNFSPPKKPIRAPNCVFLL